VSAFASVISPYSYGAAIELGNRLWSKKVLPVGDIEYRGRMLHFTPAYIRGLADAFHKRAYDQVSFQLADSANSHTNDPERHRGTIVDMKAQADGLYVTLQPTPRGEQILAENPYLGVSARIVEQFQRGDGAFFPAAIQHVLGTLDPRVPGLGAWEPVDMANGGDSSVTIDLSNYSFAGEPAPAYASASPLDGLSDAELDQFLDAVTEAEEEAGTMYDDPAYASAAQEFDASFSAAQAATQAREDARAAAMVEDTMNPARRDEDRMQRLISRAGQGVYSDQMADFAAESAAVELAVTTGRGPCSVPDEFGRCSGRYHSTDCSHQMSVDWAFSNPPASTGENALANFQASVELASLGAGRPVWGDQDDPDQPDHYVPQETIELAHSLADEWGLLHTSTSTPPMQMPAAPVTVYDALLEDAGLGGPAGQPQSWAGISELARSLGLK